MNNFALLFALLRGIIGKAIFDHTETFELLGADEHTLVKEEHPM